MMSAVHAYASMVPNLDLDPSCSLRYISKPLKNEETLWPTASAESKGGYHNSKLFWPMEGEEEGCPHGCALRRSDGGRLCDGFCEDVSVLYDMMPAPPDECQ